MSDLEIGRVDEGLAGDGPVVTGHDAQALAGEGSAVRRSSFVARHSSSVTIADGVMVLIGVAAVVLRLGDLAQLPLSAAEATAALANWQFWSAAPLDVPVISPAYFAFTHLIMSLGLGGDVAARLVPAVFGLLTALLPWALRRRTHPAAWLTAALFLAVSPMLVAVSRTAGGDAISLFALLLLALSGWAGGRRRAIIAGIALGIGLAGSPLFYSGLAALLLAWAAAGPQPPTTAPLTTDPLNTAPPATDPLTTDPPTTDPLNTASLLPFLLTTGITFLAVATSFLLYPAGLGAALRIFPAWLAQFGLPAGGETLSPLLALLRYEPALLVLGLPAAVWAWAAGGRAGRALTTWLAAALLIVVAQPGVMANAAATLLPGYLLVGLPAAALITRSDVNRRSDRRTVVYTAGGILLLGALLLAAGGRLARLNLLAGENSALILLAGLAFVLAGLAVVLAMAWESRSARRGAFLGVMALLLFWQWGAAWQLSRLGANDPRERWVAEGTDDDARVMVDLLARISRQTANSDRDLAVFSLVDSPVLRWYLRDFTGYRSGATLPVTETTGASAPAPDVVIAPAETEPVLYADYFGADFGLTQRDAAAVGRSPISEVLKWWLFRESAAPLETERVVVWVRGDLAGEK